jgi:hypothetical protein
METACHTYKAVDIHADISAQDTSLQTGHESTPER